MSDETPKRHDQCMGIDYYSCEEAIKRLNDYLDHELSDTERAVVLRHLEICKPCLKRFSFEQTLMVNIRAKLTVLRTPGSLKDKLRDIIRS